MSKYCTTCFYHDELRYAFQSLFYRGPGTTILARQSRARVDRKIGRRFAPLWRVLSSKLQSVFPSGDNGEPNIVPSIDYRAQVLNMYDRKNGIGMPVFRLALVGEDRMFIIVPLRVPVPGLCGETMQQIIREASSGNDGFIREVRWPTSCPFAAERVKALFHYAALWFVGNCR